jgi:polysaccharide biosynthesis PFTS motif protein
MFKMTIFDRLKFLARIIVMTIFKKNFLSHLVYFEDIFEYALLKRNRFIYDYCFFNNPKIISKPSWLEYNESKKKNSVIFYFYSINIFPIINKKIEKNSDVTGLFCSTWKIFWIWNVGQLNWLNSNIKNSFSHRFINPFSWEGSKIKVPSYQNKKIITIFDVPPKKLFTISQLVNPYNHYNFNFCIRFLKDIIYNPAIKNNIIFLKIKRDYLGIDIRYKNFLEKVSRNKNVRVYYNEISPTSLIRKSNLVISIPFTTPALVAKFFRKKSFYYNPYLLIKKSRYYPEGIKIVTKDIKLTTILNKFNNQ